MGFFNDEGTASGGRRRNWRDNFVRLSPQKPVVIQFLEPEVKTVVWKHYIPQARRKSGERGISIVCPGIDICPICQRNAELNDRDHPDYIRTTKRYVVNVLDLTHRVVCPLCENANERKECDYCGTDLTDVEPKEPEVKLLEGGKRLFTQLNTLEETNTYPYDPDSPLLDPEVFNYAGISPGDEIPLGLTHYPVKIVVSDAEEPRDRVPTPIPAGQPNDINWRDYQDRLIDPDDVYLSLEAVEVRELLDGGSLSEILKRRYQREQASQSEEVELEASI